MILRKLNWDINLEVLESLPDGEYEIKPFKKDRTSRQNRYLWWVVYKTLADYTGYDTDYIHQQLWWMFLTDYETYRNPYIRSTASLTTEEFWEYVDKIILRAWEHGVYIPSPEDYFTL